jgi:hypothetical protein
MSRILLHRDETPVQAGDVVMTMAGSAVTITDWATTGEDRVTVHVIDGITKDYEATVLDLVWQDAP